MCFHGSFGGYWDRGFGIPFELWGYGNQHLSGRTLTYYPLPPQISSIPYVGASYHIYPENQMATQLYNGFHQSVEAAQIAPVSAQGMKVDQNNTALVITDPQNDFLSPNGVAWNLVKDSVAENHTIENIELLLKTAKVNKFKVFVSPHWYYPYDKKMDVWGSHGTFDARSQDVSKKKSIIA
ncbi:cysteine hydrolase [Paenibacillus spongiae]|uniref:cysteine hydrolase n=1 Tax=Paenibacillus spongiae TaxID=2909671 RepID=UPI0021ABD3D2|nr:cysteine hydrolase [Paenibacillus spongiae]